MNQSLSNRKLVVAYPSEFKVQSAYGTPIDAADIDARHPQTTPAFHSIIPFREETRDCTGEFVTIEQLTGKIARFVFAFDFVAVLAAGWFAYLKGVSAAATGTPANEVQTLDLGGATGGNIVLDFDFEGLSGSTSEISTTAATTAAEIQNALEAVISIKKNNVVVTGSAGGPFTITFGGDLANANLPLIGITDNTTGGTGAAVTADTDGENNLHLITQSPSEQPALFSLIEGFDGETDGIKRYKDLVVNSWTVTAGRRGKPTLTIEAFGPPDPEILSGYTIPACFDDPPIRTGNTRLLIGSDYVSADLNEFSYTESNNIDVSEDALRFDDVTPDQLERGDRTALLTATIIGLPSSALYEFAEDENNAFDSFELALGRPGERLTIIAPNAQFRLDDELIRFVGGRNRSAFAIQARPSPDGSGVVTRAEYHGSHATQFLLT